MLQSTASQLPPLHPAVHLQYRSTFPLCHFPMNLFFQLVSFCLRSVTSSPPFDCDHKEGGVVPKCASACERTEAPARRSINMFLSVCECCLRTVCVCVGCRCANFCSISVHFKTLDLLFHYPPQALFFFFSFQPHGSSTCCFASLVR